MIKEAIVKIVNKEDLTYKEAYDVMNEIMNGETSPTQNAAFLAALSTKSGTADCLEALGVNIQQSPERCVELLKEAGMCFFFAQKYHSSMKYVGTIARNLDSVRYSIFWDR